MKQTRHFYGRYGPAALVLACLLVCPLALQSVLAQGRVSVKTLDTRLVRVETVLDQSMLELLQQVESLKREIRQLRGELESQAHEVQSLRKRSRDLYLDTDQRLSGVEQKMEELETQMVPLDGELPEGLPDDNTQGNLLLPEGTATQTVAGLSGSSQGTNLGKSEAAVVERVPTAAEKQAYTRAYDMLALGRNADAINEFESFLASYPTGPFSDNAWYWIGEALYAQRRFDEALDRFRNVVESFPDSNKVPDAQLKLGYSLYELKRYGEARDILTDVQADYPGRSASVLARKRLKDMAAKGL